MKIRQLATLALCAVALAACSSNKVQTVQYFQGDENTLYAKAADSILAGKFSAAEPVVTQLTLQFPFGRFKNETQVLQAYTSYKTNNYELALSQVNKYLAAYGSRAVAPYGDYMLLVHALASVDANRGLFQGAFNLNRADNDLTGVQVAISDLREIIRFFPGSPYREYAAKLENFLTNTVAQHHYKVADFYAKYNNPVAAYKRANTLLINFPNTQYARPALEILKKSAQAQGLDFTAQVADLEKQLDGIKVEPAVTKFPEPGNLTPEFLREYQKPAAK